MGESAISQAYTGHPPGGRPRRDKSSVSSARAAVLNAAADECSNLMEWLVVDMNAVAHTVLPRLLGKAMARRALSTMGPIHGLGVLGRMQAVARAVANELREPDSPELMALATFAESDVPRQWAAYAAQMLAPDARSRLTWAKISAADSNMTVRECAWMAFRPEVVRNPHAMLRSMQRLTIHRDANVRRFAVEVCRPRSVWGAHIPELKTAPQLGESLLTAVACDESRYVRLAVGNWINDAAKGDPVWAKTLFRRWDQTQVPVAPDVRRRALRNVV
jgi:3-methyladenine DNA glycosylase AlkC